MPFALEKEMMEMEWKEEPGKEKSQILLEGDMIVPDSKPDLQEILRCEGKVRLKEKRISDDRLSFSGDLEVERRGKASLCHEGSAARGGFSAYGRAGERDGCSADGRDRASGLPYHQ